MSRYRDDVQQLRLRKEELEQDLDETEKQLSGQAAQLEQHRATLDAKEAELAALRAKLAAAQPAELDPEGKKICASCGRASPAHYRFCLGCGQQLPDEVVAGRLAHSAPATAAADPNHKARAKRTLIMFIAISAALFLFAFLAVLASYLR